MMENQLGLRQVLLQEAYEEYEQQVDWQIQDMSFLVGLGVDRCRRRSR